MKVTLSMLSTLFFFPSASSLFTFSRKALLSSPSTMRPSSSTTATPSTSRFVIFKATLFSSSSESGSGGNPRRSRKAYQNRMFPGALHRKSKTGQRSNHQAANSSPRRTCNSRIPDRSTYSDGTPTAASKRDSTAKDLRQDRRDSGCSARLQKMELQTVPARPGPALIPTSRRVPRLDGYNTVKGIGDRE